MILDNFLKMEKYVSKKFGNSLSNKEEQDENENETKHH